MPVPPASLARALSLLFPMLIGREGWKPSERSSDREDALPSVSPTSALRSKYAPYWNSHIARTVPWAYWSTTLRHRTGQGNRWNIGRKSYRPIFLVQCTALGWLSISCVKAGWCDHQRQLDIRAWPRSREPWRFTRV